MRLSTVIKAGLAVGTLGALLFSSDFAWGNRRRRGCLREG